MTEIDQTSKEGYCVKCRHKRPIASPQAVYTKTGTPGTRGQCPECGTNIFRMGATPAHEGVPKPEKIERPTRKTSKSQDEEEKNTR